LQYEFNSIPVSILKVLFVKKNQINLVNLEFTPRIRNLSFKKIAISSFAYFFLSTGFLISFSFAILFSEYRMTMAQLTTIFHGFGAIILAMYIDPMLSRSLDVELENFNWIENIYSIFIVRLFAYLNSLVIFLIFYLLTSSI